MDPCERLISALEADHAQQLEAAPEHERAELRFDQRIEMEQLVRVCTAIRQLADGVDEMDRVLHTALDAIEAQS
ncbi:MAG: hypothetical protein VYA51_13020 [Planctomycetota bacterium]|nr:hypothetical protein [Planctomycetota bacterium]